jgi:hypothetical protein
MTIHPGSELGKGYYINSLALSLASIVLLLRELDLIEPFTFDVLALDIPISWSSLEEGRAQLQEEPGVWMHSCRNQILITLLLHDDAAQCSTGGQNNNAAIYLYNDSPLERKFPNLYANAKYPATQNINPHPQRFLSFVFQRSLLLP